MKPTRRRALFFPVVVFATFWAIGVALWAMSGYVQPVFLFTRQSDLMQVDTTPNGVLDLIDPCPWSELPPPFPPPGIGPNFFPGICGMSFIETGQASPTLTGILEPAQAPNIPVSGPGALGALWLGLALAARGVLRKKLVGAP